jgi:hypothetical protein
MKATRLLKDDHARVKKLFAQLGRTTARAAKRRARLVERIACELQVHAQIEEEIFYPAAEDVDALLPLVQAARKDHVAMKKLLADLRGVDPAGDGFLPKLQKLRDAVLHHAIDQEEKHLFPVLERELGDDALTRLGLELRARRQNLLRVHGPATKAA